MSAPRPEQPLVSVVTPVFNGEAHLRRCVDSIVAQTWDRWDYTIVDNCSTDGTAAIAAEYAARDPRIRVVRNREHVRVIPNHNIAVRHASPQCAYVKVVSADDWIFPECLERMVLLAEASPTVGIVGAYGLRETRIAWAGLPPDREVFPGREVARQRLLGASYVFGAPTSVLYRAELVRERDPFYNEGNLHADEEVCFQAFDRWDFGFVHQILTFTRAAAESLTGLSRRLNTYLPSYVHGVLRYGPTYLSPEEVRARLRELLRDYYRFLARAALEMRPASFWAFHRARLRELGYPLSFTRLLGAILLLVFELVLNPLDTARRVYGRIFPSRRPAPVAAPDASRGGSMNARPAAGGGASGE